jgi:hypothetical protein
MTSRWERWRDRRYKRKYCFHHKLPDLVPDELGVQRVAKSYIRSQLIETGKYKMFWCGEELGGCGKMWIV